MGFGSQDGKVRFKDRLQLLALLPQAGWGCLATLIGLQLLDCVTPSAVSVALAWLTAGISRTKQSSLLGHTAVPLAAYAGVLVLAHTGEIFGAPMKYIVKMRIDGNRRAQIAQLVVGYPTLDVLEDQGTHELIRLAKAEPRNWTERTPGDGALAQLRMFAGLTGMVTSCAVLAYFSLWLAGCLLIATFLMRVLQSRNGTLFLREWRRGLGEGMRATVWSSMLSEPAMSKEVRIFGFADIAVARMRKHMLAMLQPTWRAAAKNTRVQWLRFALVMSGLGLCYGIAADESARGRITVAEETAVLLSAWSIYRALSGYDARDVLGALPGQRAFLELRARLHWNGTAPPSPTESGAAIAQAAPQRRTEPPVVYFEDIRFQYPKAPKPVFDGLTLKIEPGELLAVVGLNGAGKSTLIKLLAGLYRPDSGTITADGRDIWTGDAIGQWRSVIAVVFQEFARPHLSLRENIAIGRPAPELGRTAAMTDAFDRAVAKAGLDSLVDRLPRGLDTLLSRSRTNGVDLSGGQWQQVVLARALYAIETGARLIVLDEPTAHLDVQSEYEIFKRLSEERGDSTVVLISHRLSTVRQADRIVLLENGRIVETGSHDELLCAHGRYADMFRIQAERFTPGMVRPSAAEARR